MKELLRVAAARRAAPAAPSSRSAPGPPRACAGARRGRRRLPRRLAAVRRVPPVPAAARAPSASAVWALACPRRRRSAARASRSTRCASTSTSRRARLAAGLKRRGAARSPGSSSRPSRRTAKCSARPPGRSRRACTRACAPAVAERNLVGDWPVRARARAARRRAALADAQLGYERLLAPEAKRRRPRVEAKAYGLLNGGAAAFGAPTYGDDAIASVRPRRCSREIHPDAGCVGWNWGAPFKQAATCSSAARTHS